MASTCRRSPLFALRLSPTACPPPLAVRRSRTRVLLAATDASDTEMVPELRGIALDVFWWDIFFCLPKVLLWLLTMLTVPLCEASTFLKLLLFWVPNEFVHSIVFAVNHLNIVRDLCVVDLRFYERSGYYGFRKDYITRVPDFPGTPLFRDAEGVPQACWWFHDQEVRCPLVPSVESARGSDGASASRDRLRAVREDDGGYPASPVATPLAPVLSPLPGQSLTSSARGRSGLRSVTLFCASS